MFEYGLSLDPTHVHLLTNLGSAYNDLGFIEHSIT